MDPETPSRPQTLPESWWRFLERAAVVLLLILATVPRARDLDSSFDRGFEGYQGAFFAIAAVNYERLGVGAFGGYPILNVDLPGGSLETAKQRPAEWLTYHNHPPTTPLLAWSALHWMGPEGWAEAWREGRSPRGVEIALRLPFLLLHLAGLLALWWLARVAFGTQVALLALALMTTLPVSALYGTLVNYENPSLVFALLAVGCYGAHVRSARKRHLVGMGLALGVGCAVTFAPAFFLPPLVLRSAWRRRWREAFSVGLVGGLACAVPLLLHDAWARHSLAAIGKAPLSIQSRAEVLLQPLFDGSMPIWDWLDAQWQHSGSAIGVPLVIAGLAGFALCAARALSSRMDGRLRALEWPRSAHTDVDLALPLLLGGSTYLLAFYRHTGEEQWPFLLYLAPGAALLAARAVHQLSGPLQRLRGGTAPLVLVAATLALPGLVRFEAWRFANRAPGPRDDTALEAGPDAPLPLTVGDSLAQLLPAGSVGFTPTQLGLNPASTWYAWRSLLPISAPDDPTPRAIADAVGLAAAARYLVVPVDPPPAARRALESFQENLGPPDVRTATWLAWKCR